MSDKHNLVYQKNAEIVKKAIDSHAHLDRFCDVDKIINNMQEEGLESIILMAGDEGSLNQALKLTNEHKNLYFMFGIHPFEIENFDETKMKEIFEQNKFNPSLVGLGEIGLDYSRDNGEETKLFQQQVFIKQLKIAHEYNLPVSIHIRDAHDDARRILRENTKLLKAGGIIHCCSATEEEVKDYIELGFYISFSGTITYGKKNREYYLEETLKRVPKDKILIETDCPFLCPAPYRGRENEPKYVLVTAEKIAEVLGMNINDLIELTTKNVKTLLKLVK